MSAETLALLTRARDALAADPPWDRLWEGALRVAGALVGEHEVGGPNQGPIVEFCFGYFVTSPVGPRSLWCAGLVSTAYLVAEVYRDLARADRPPSVDDLGKLLGRHTAWREVASLSCDTLWNRAAVRGWTLTQVEQAQPGDLIFFGPAGDLEHVGLVVELQGGRTLRTVEGNAGNEVRRRTYDLSFPRLYGLVRVPL